VAYSPAFERALWVEYTARWAEWGVVPVGLGRRRRLVEALRWQVYDEIKFQPYYFQIPRLKRDIFFAHHSVLYPAEYFHLRGERFRRILWLNRFEGEPTLLR
jgi:hypothetical protein